MSSFSQALPTQARDSMVGADLGQGLCSEAVLLLPVAAQPASVTDGTSNTIIFGVFAGRFGSRTEMTRLWNAPGPLATGFGLLLPAAPLLRLQAGMLLPGLQLQPCTDQGQPPKAPMPALKAMGNVAGIGTSTGTAGFVGVWIQPLSIIAILIGL